MEDKIIVPAVANEVNNSTNSNNMNNKIDFESMCGEETVAQTAKVDQQVVNDLFKAFIANPTLVIARFRNDCGYLKMAVTMNHNQKIRRNYETYADAKLIECMISAMRTDKADALEAYNIEEHSLEASDVDPRIDIFRQFINSPFRCRFDVDFVAGNGDRYICATFNIGFRKEIKFCLKRTAEIESIINEAIQAA